MGSHVTFGKQKQNVCSNKTLKGNFCNDEANKITVHRKEKITCKNKKKKKVRTSVDVIAMTKWRVEVMRQSFKCWASLNLELTIGTPTWGTRREPIWRNVIFVLLDFNCNFWVESSNLHISQNVLALNTQSRMTRSVVS